MRNQASWASRWISWLLVICMTISLFPASALTVFADGAEDTVQNTDTSTPTETTETNQDPTETTAAVEPLADGEGEGTTGASSSEPAQDPWKQSYRNAVFSVVWGDQSNRLGRRPDDVKSLILLFADGAPVDLSRLAIVSAGPVTDTAYGTDTYTYTIRNLPVYQGGTQTPITYTLGQVLLPGYTAFPGVGCAPAEVLETLAAPTQIISLAAGTEGYQAQYSFGNYLPIYNISGTITWPQETAELVRPDIDLFFTEYFDVSQKGTSVTYSKDESDSNVWNFTVSDLLMADDFGMPAEHTLTAAELEGFELEAAAITVSGASDAPAFVYAEPKEKPVTTVTTTETSCRINWLDASGIAGNQHPGELQLSLSYTVGGVTYTISGFTWNTETGRYTHDWTEEEKTRLQLNEDATPLSIVDYGENSLNRTLTALRLPNRIATTLGETVLHETIIIWGAPVVHKVNWEARKLSDGVWVDEYQVTAVAGGYELIPMRKISFNLSIRSGSDSLDTVNMILRDLINERYPGFQLVTTAGSNSQAETIPLDEIMALFDPATGRAAYKRLVPVFDGDKTELVYSLVCRLDPAELPDTDPHYSDSTYRYCVAYSNVAVAGRGNDTSRTYAGGTLILTKTGHTEYNATKIWLDEEPDARPSLNYTLWRYADNGVADYTTASQVYYIGADDTIIDSFALDREQTEVTIFHAGLTRYNSDGYPYVYFIREHMPGGTGYEKVYGRVSEDGSITDIVPYGTIRLETDTSVYDNGTLSNRRVGTVTVEVTKSWKTAYYQTRLEDICVELTAFSKPKNVRAEADNQWAAAQTHIMSGFNVLNTSQTLQLNMPRYDFLGRELQYKLVETGIYQLVDGEKTETSYMDANGVPITHDDLLADAARMDPDEGFTFRFMLPMNEQTLKEESIEGATDYFISQNETVTDAAGNSVTEITNSVDGRTAFYVRKTWHHELTPEDVTVNLCQISSTGSVDANYRTYTILATEEVYGIIPAGAGADSGWIRAFDELPRYDENGNIYTYMILEGDDRFHPTYTPGSDVDDDGEVENNAASIYNLPAGGYVRLINLRKLWLDDSVTTDRAACFFNIALPDGTLLYGVDGENTGIISTEPVRISAADSWWLRTDVTVFMGDDGQWYLPGEAVAKGFYTEEHLYAGNYVVTEVQMGGSPVLTDAEHLTGGGYATVTNGDTTYAVMYNGANGGTYHTHNGMAVNPAASVMPVRDGDEEYYTVTNLRIGSYDLTLYKTWKDGVHHEARPEATFTLTCEEAPESVQDGYISVSPVLAADGKMPILGGDPTNLRQVGSSQTLNGTGANGEDIDQQFLYFMNLPLYDEAGKIMHYYVQETMPADTDYVGHSGPVEYEYVGSSVHAAQKIHNQPQDSRPVDFHLLWLDEYRMRTQQRPDVYLTLYWTVTDEQGNITVEPYGFREYLWTRGENDSEDVWTYTFGEMPEYDEEGNKITYYATIRTHVDFGSLDYTAPQYSAGKNENLDGFMDNKKSVVVYNSGTDAYEVHYSAAAGVVSLCSMDGRFVMQEGNTFTLQLKENVHVAGRKTWEKLPIGFPSSELPTISFFLETRGALSGGNLDTTEAGLVRAVILDCVSPAFVFDITINYVGLNTPDGMLVPAEEVLPNGQTALEYWESLENRDVNLAYGEPLPQYTESGAMYDYTITEVINTAGTSVEGKVDTAYENLAGRVNGYNVINTYRTGDQNSREITVDKSWAQIGKDALPDGFVYPETEYTLYRFYVNTNSTRTYSDVEAVAVITLSAEDAAAGTTVSFGSQYIYAPNGNPYIYYVGETKVLGYDAPALTLPADVTVTEDAGQDDSWPADADSQWYSQAFKLTGGENAVAVKTTAANTYTGGWPITLSGRKIWNDYQNRFNPRPDTLQLTLYRKANGMGAEIELATIVLDGTNNTAAVTVADGVENVTGEITVTLSADRNIWSFSIEGPDAYASNGNPWQYRVVETLEENDPYFAEKGASNWTSVNGTAATAALSDLINSDYTELIVTKDWVGLNEAVAKPSVTMALQVSDDDGTTWHWAKEYFTGDQAIIYRSWERTITTGSDTAAFVELPAGYVNEDDGSYKLFQYRAREVKIGNQPVAFNGVEYASDAAGANGTAYDVQTSDDRENMTTAFFNSAETTEITVTKIWSTDGNNVFRTRGDVDGNAQTEWSVAYHIYRSYTDSQGNARDERVNRTDGEDAYVLYVSGMNSEDAASATLAALPAKSPEQYVYTYYAVELNPDGSEIQDSATRYNGSYGVAVNAERTEFTNTLHTVDLEVSKLWVGDSEGFRPEELSLTLWRSVSGGAAEDISSSYIGGTPDWENTDSDTWTLTYSNLPKFDPSGQEYIYTVKENQQPGYETPGYAVGTPAHDDDQAYTVTNTATEFTLDKVGMADGQGTVKSLNHVILEFTSINAIGGSYYRLTWIRDANGAESYEIHTSADQTDWTLWNLGAAESGSVVIVGLPAGTYQLTAEPTVPNGYTNSAVGSYFTVCVDGTLSAGGALSVTESGLKLRVADAPTTLTVSKQAIVDEEPVELSDGWIFSIEGAFAAGDDTLTDVQVRYIAAADVELSPEQTALMDGSLVAGQTYTLREVQAPAGYLLAYAEAVFTLAEDGGITITNADGIGEVASVSEDNAICFVNEPFTITVTKKNKVAQPLEGAVFSLEKYSEDAGWQMICDTLITDEEGVISLLSTDYSLESGGEYRLTETKAPFGFVLDTTPIWFSLDQDGNIVESSLALEGRITLADRENTAYDKGNLIVLNEAVTTSFTFVKVSELDHEKTVAGAVYGLYRDGELIDTDTADENGRVIFRGLLMDVDYTICELEACAGSYLSKNAVVFRYTLDDEGQVQLEKLDDGDGTVIQTEDDILWLEPQVVVSILKTDPDGKPLAGAVLQLQDEAGNVIPVITAAGTAQSWTTTEEPFAIVSQLTAGQTYVLVELSAPEGYQVAAPVTFAISAETVAPGENKVVSVTMVDALAPELPKTGDTQRPELLLGTAVFSALAVIGLLLLGKRRKKLEG